MTDAQLSYDLSANPNEEKHHSRLLDIDLNNLVDSKEESNATILAAIFDSYKIIDSLNKDIQNADQLKDRYLRNIEKILLAIQQLDYNSRYKEEFVKFLKIEKIIFSKSSKETLTKEDIVKFKLALKRIEYFYDSLMKNEKHNKNTNLHGAPEIEDYDDNLNTFSISRIDSLYRKLYEALCKDNMSKITLYRGRIIRQLRRHKKEIEINYQKIRCLNEIKKVLEGEEKESEQNKIAEILEQEYSAMFRGHLSRLINSKDEFEKKFNELYEMAGVEKIVFYYEALQLELKEHKRVLEERYSKEFLDKKVTLFNATTIAPKAINLAIKRIASTIYELKEAKVNRQKIAKGFELIKDTGRLMATPAIILGKFIASNWYTLLLMYHGYNNGKSNAHGVNAETQSPMENTETINGKEQNTPSKPLDHNGSSRYHNNQKVEEYTDTGTGGKTVIRPILNVNKGRPEPKPELGIKEYTDTGTGGEEVKPIINVNKGIPEHKSGLDIKEYTDTRTRGDLANGQKLLERYINRENNTVREEPNLDTSTDAEFEFSSSASYDYSGFVGKFDHDNGGFYFFSIAPLGILPKSLIDNILQFNQYPEITV